MQLIANCTSNKEKYQYNQYNDKHNIINEHKKTDIIQNYHYKISYFIIIRTNTLQIIIDNIVTMNKKLCLL